MRKRVKFALWLLAGTILLSPMRALAAGDGSTATGDGALTSETAGLHNTADGFWALHATTSGIDNTAVGYGALTGNTTASNNTAVGSRALQTNTTGTSNTALGRNALVSNSTGVSNTAAGDGAMFANSTGKENTAAGFGALGANTIGAQNTATGVQALNFNTTGKFNSAIGYQALFESEAGSNNVAIGANALRIIEGSNNIALGANAGKLTAGGSNNIYIGSNGIVGNENKVTRIGQTQTKAFIAGVANVAGSGKTVIIKPDGQLGVTASSARYKQGIEELSEPGHIADKLARLRPVSFHYTAEPEAAHYGLIAEDVEQVMPELVIRDGDNRPDSVDYVALIPLLLQQWKVQKAELAQQRILIERQNEELAELRRGRTAPHIRAGLGPISDY
jgi:hypothetical protein